MILSFCLSVMTCNVHCGTLGRCRWLEVVSCTIVFLAGNFLFTASDTFAIIGYIVLRVIGSEILYMFLVLSNQKLQRTKGTFYAAVLATKMEHICYNFSRHIHKH